jgi:cytochrome c553
MANMLTEQVKHGVKSGISAGQINWRSVKWIVAAILLLQAIASPSVNADGLGYDGLPPQELCGLCHQLNGISATAKFPKLAGQKAAYIEKQLRDFLAGHRANDGGQMETIITEIRPDQFAVVAQYFSSLKPPLPHTEAASSKDANQTARSIYENGKPVSGVPACKSCHGNGENALPVAPHLSAQHAGYLEKQLNDFRSGGRRNDSGAKMRQIAAKLSQTEIRALAAYLASQPRDGG